MTVIAPAISPDAIIACASSSGTQRTSVASSASGSPASSAPAAEEQVLRVVRVADQGLARQNKLHAHGPPACLLLHLARRRCRGILAVIDVAARQLPHPHGSR